MTPREPLESGVAFKSPGSISPDVEFCEVQLSVAVLPRTTVVGLAEREQLGGGCETVTCLVAYVVQVE